MKKTKLDWLGVIGMSLLLCGGCSKSEEKAVTVEEVPEVIEEAFKQAEPEVSKQVTEVVGSVREKDPKALSELQTLTERTDLTLEQRQAADRAKYALLLRLQEAAKNGDQKADAEVKKYRATK